MVNGSDFPSQKRFPTTAGVATSAALLGAICILGLVGCASTHAPPSYETVRQDLPLFINRTDRVTELLDGTVTGGEIIAVGEAGTVLRSEDSGHSWQKSEVPLNATLTGVSFASDAEHGWAVGHDGTILASADRGQTWQQQWPGGTAESFLGVCAVSERRVIAVGADGLYAETSDAGANWTRRRLIERDSRLNRITRGPSGTLYIAGEHGTMLRSTDDGVTWRPLRSPETKMLYGILPLGKRTLLAYGANMAGQVYRSDDNGETWSAIMIAKHSVFVTAVKRRDETLFLATSSGGRGTNEPGGFFISRDDGRSFKPWNNRQNANTIQLLEAPDGSLVVFGTEGSTILKSE